jgi:FAD/FMN-containing dehydrogenase/Fe-S oxidoreductase
MSLATSTILDRSPSTLARALREMVKGDVFDDPFTRTMYSTDGSIYEIEPLVVVHPLDELDVRSCLWFGQKHGIPVVARGGGSGVAGESLAKGIIVDLSVYMKGIVELDKGRKQVTVQTGVVLDSLNRALKPHGFRVGPDPLNGNRSTIGGMIARNASGPHSIYYGDMRKSLVGARLCLMDGTVTLANPVKLTSADFEGKKREEGLSGKVHREVPDLLQKNAALIASKQVKTERNRAGYMLEDALTAEVYDLAKVLCGSEGTLGIVTQAVLKVHPLPERVGMLEIFFKSLLEAAKAVAAVRALNPFGCELLDEKMIALRRQGASKGAQFAPESAKAMLIVEIEGQGESDVTDGLAAVEAKLKDIPHISARRVLEPEQEAQIWAARAAGTSMLYRRKDSLQPVPVVEDAAVPLDKLATYIEKAGKVFEKYKLEWSAWSNAGQGEVHVMPMMDLRTKAHLDILEKVAGEIHAIVWECGGTISATHGEGLARSQWLEKQAGKELFAVFKELKSIFDPSGLLNPNKKITIDAHLMLKSLRFGTQYEFSTGARPKPSSIDPTQAANYRMFLSQTSVRSELTVDRLATNLAEIHPHGVSPLKWAGNEMAREAESCNGCGYCRTTGPEEEMCPRYKYERIEDASPRAKANIMRRMMDGRQTGGSFSSEELIEIMDTCFNCKLCHDGCPSNVNIPKLVLEAKARYYQSHSLPRSTKILSGLEDLFRVASYVAPLYNTVVNALPMRYARELMTGIDHRHKMPTLNRWRPQRRYMPSAGSERPKVVLYLDLEAKYSNPQLAQAAVDVLEHNGFEVELPDAPWCKSPALSEGAVEIGRVHVAKVAHALAPYAFKGVPIVALDATACMCLQEDFLAYVDTPETRAVARHTVEIGQFLMRLQSEGKLKTEFHRIDAVVGYHQACHHKSLHIGVPGLELMRQVPGLNVIQLNHGCCGNPSMWGMIKENYDESMWIGKKLFEQLKDERKEIEYAVSESSCCRTQMAHGAEKPTLHPIEVLALAYGYEAPHLRDDDAEEPPAPPAHADHHSISVSEPTPSMSAHDHDSHNEGTAHGHEAHASH